CGRESRHHAIVRPARGAQRRRTRGDRRQGVGESRLTGGLSGTRAVPSNRSESQVEPMRSVAGEPAAAAAPAEPLADGASRWQLLERLLTDVVERYEPAAARVLRGEATTENLPPRVLARALQAQGILFQLLAIAEQNRDMRNRRELEREQGH